MLLGLDRCLGDGRTLHHVLQLLVRVGGDGVDGAVVHGVDDGGGSGDGRQNVVFLHALPDGAGDVLREQHGGIHSAEKLLHGGRTRPLGADAQNELKAIATTEPAATEAAPTEKVTYTEPPAPTETEALTDGWHTINGKRYYIQDGEKYVDLQEIDNALYYFDEDGALAENEDVDYYGTTLHAGRDGIIGGITYDEIWGNWSDERYSFGNGGHSSIIEFNSEIENCDSFQFCLEAGGLHGAKVNGTWKIYIRCNGNWEFAQDINYTEPNGYFDIKLDGYKNFDAITACPMVQGNATYSAVFYLQNVHCVL